jgi:hypothetical protein
VEEAAASYITNDGIVFKLGHYQRSVNRNLCYDLHFRITKQKMSRESLSRRSRFYSPGI